MYTSARFDDYCHIDDFEVQKYYFDVITIYPLIFTIFSI